MLYSFILLYVWQFIHHSYILRTCSDPLRRDDVISEIQTFIGNVQAKEQRTVGGVLLLPLISFLFIFLVWMSFIKTSIKVIIFLNIPQSLGNWIRVWCFSMVFVIVSEHPPSLPLIIWLLSSFSVGCFVFCFFVYLEFQINMVRDLYLYANTVHRNFLRFTLPSL